MIRAVSSTFWK